MDGFAAMVGPEAWTRFTGLGRSRTYEAGEILLLQGGTPAEVLLLMRGWVKIALTDDQGNALPLAIRGPGEVLGELAVLDGTTHSATVSAIDRCEVRAATVARFTGLLRALRLEDQIFRGTVRRLRESERARLELAAMPARERVVRTLLRFAVPSGRDDGCFVIDLDQTEFGRAVALSRGRVADILRELRLAGAISTGRGRIVVEDLAALRGLTAPN